MCLSTVYIDADGQLRKIMEDVAGMEAKDDGFMFVNLFGEGKFVRGRLKSMDFVDDNSVILEEWPPTFI